MWLKESAQIKISCYSKRQVAQGTAQQSLPGNGSRKVRLVRYWKVLKILVLPNRIHSATGLHTVRDSLNNLDALILPIIVPQKNLFVNFSTLKSEEGYQSIADEILKHV